MGEQYFGFDFTHLQQNRNLFNSDTDPLIPSYLQCAQKEHSTHIASHPHLNAHSSPMQINRSRKKKKQMEINPNQKTGHWAYYENKKYHWFLQIYSSHFIKSERRRTDKIFKSMANFICTREAEQCRSHHQKMEKKYKTYFKILKHLRQTHYKTTDPTPLKAEILTQGLKSEALLSEETLQTQEVEEFKSNEDINEEDLLVQKYCPESTSEKLEEEKQKQEEGQVATDECYPFHVSNLLSEDYSKNLHLQGSDYDWVDRF